MQEAVRQLEGGFKPHLMDRTKLPATHRLTRFQQRGLADNVDAVINVVKRGVASGRKTADIGRTLAGQLGNPRFRFLDQIPHAKQRLLQTILNLFDPDDQIRILEYLLKQGVS